MSQGWGPPPGGYGLPSNGPGQDQGQDPGPGARNDEAELAAMRDKIANLQRLYMILFIASLVLLAATWMIRGVPGIVRLAWAGSLGGAVITRLRRQSLVNTYNARLAGGRSAPLT